MLATTIISLVIAFVSCSIAVISFVVNRKDKSNNELDAMNTTLIKQDLKLDHICNTTNETRTDIKAMNQKIQDLDKEISVVKCDVQTAFIRIDELKEKVGK